MAPESSDPWSTGIMLVVSFALTLVENTPVSCLDTKAVGL